MALDPRISLAVQAPEITAQPMNPYQLLGGALSLQQLMTQGQMQQLQLDQARQAVEERQKIGQILADQYSGLNGAAPIAPAAAPTLGSLVTAAPAVTAPAAITGAQPLSGAAAGPFVIPPVPGAVGAPTVVPTGLRSGEAPPVAPILPPTTLTPTTATTTQAATTGTAAGETPSTTHGGLDYSRLFGRILQAAPVTGMDWIDRFAKGQKDMLGVQDAQLGLAQKQTGRLASLAQGINSPDTQFTNVSKAYNEGLFGTGPAAIAMRDHLLKVPYDDPTFDSFIKSAVEHNQFLENARADVKLGWDAVNQAHTELKFPYELRKLKTETATGELGAIDAQTANDAVKLSAAARRGDADREAVYSQLSPNSQALFAGLKTPDEIMSATYDPKAYEARRQHDITAAKELADLQFKKQEIDAKFGPGSIAAQAENVWVNPDYASEIPAESRSSVMQYYQKAHPGYAFPVKVGPQAAQQELAARNTISTIGWMRQALENPTIAKNIGPIMGRLGELRQNIGTELGLNSQEAALAQEFRTKMSTLLIDEAKTVAGRIGGPVMKQLQGGAPKVEMDADLLKGALNAVEANAQTTADNVDAQRHGGKARPRSVRGFAAIVPDAISQPLASQKPGKYRMKVGDQESWWRKNPDGTIESIAPPQ
jgi:hypothetical protein